jgi:hypothetical protein
MYQMPAASSFFINDLLRATSGQSVNINIGPVPAHLGLPPFLLGQPFFGGGSSSSGFGNSGMGSPFQSFAGSQAGFGNSGMSNPFQSFAGSQTGFPNLASMGMGMMMPTYGNNPRPLAGPYFNTAGLMFSPMFPYTLT